MNMVTTMPSAGAGRLATSMKGEGSVMRSPFPGPGRRTRAGTQAARSGRRPDTCLLFGGWLGLGRGRVEQGAEGGQDRQPRVLGGVVAAGLDLVDLQPERGATRFSAPTPLA